MVSVLAIGPKVRRFKPLRAIKIRSTPSFGWEAKPEAPCREILRNVKKSLEKYEQKYFAKPNLSFPSPVTPACY
jgi:hypothetical protein